LFRIGYERPAKYVASPLLFRRAPDPHLVPTSDVIRCLAEVAGVAPEEIELLDLWAER
jgi:hypothetical protein